MIEGLKPKVVIIFLFALIVLAVLLYFVTGRGEIIKILSRYVSLIFGQFA